MKQSGPPIRFRCEQRQEWFEVTHSEQVGDACRERFGFARIRGPGVLTPAHEGNETVRGPFNESPAIAAGDDLATVE